MRAVHESQPFAQRSTARRSSWWQRVAELIAALAVVVAVTPMALAQPVEIAYNTFLDPNNANDPSAAAQTKMIAEFERLESQHQSSRRGRSDRLEWRPHPPHACRFARRRPRDELPDARVRRDGVAHAARRAC